MRTIEIDKELLLVEVPKDAIKLIIDNCLQYLIYDVPNYKNWVTDDILGDYNKLQDFLSTHKSENDWKRGGKKLPEGNFELIGLIETPNLEFDFEVNESWVERFVIKNLGEFGYINYIERKVIENRIYETECQTKEQSFRTRIQKTIQDNGLYLDNPKSHPLEYECTNRRHYEDIVEKWQEAEEKTIKGNLLLIKKN